MDPTGRDAVGQSILAIIKKDFGMAGRMSLSVLRKETNGSASISGTGARASTLGSSTKGMLDFYWLEDNADYQVVTVSPSTRTRRWRRSCLHLRTTLRLPLSDLPSQLTTLVTLVPLTPLLLLPLLLLPLLLPLPLLLVPPIRRIMLFTRASRF